MLLNFFDKEDHRFYHTNQLFMLLSNMRQWDTDSSGRRPICLPTRHPPKSFCVYVFNLIHSIVNPASKKKEIMAQEVLKDDDTGYDDEGREAIGRRDTWSILSAVNLWEGRETADFLSYHYLSSLCSGISYRSLLHSTARNLQISNLMEYGCNKS